MANTGKKFEELIKESCAILHYDCNRMRDAGWTGEQTSRRFTVKNICDFTIFNGVNLFYIEAKSGKTSIAFDRLTQHKDLIKKDSEGSRNVCVGYFFEVSGEWFFGDVVVVDWLISNIGKKSINAKDMHEWLRVIPPFTPGGKRKARMDLAIL